MYTYSNHDVYHVTTIRLTPAQKRKLEGARKVIEAHRGRRMSRGEAVAHLAEFALDRRAELVEQNPEVKPSWLDDPLLDPNIGWDMGYTDEKTVDRLLYGRK